MPSPSSSSSFASFFFFNDTATTEIYTLSLHDALPICIVRSLAEGVDPGRVLRDVAHEALSRTGASQDRKSTRLNSSHQIISYAVFCLKKKNKRQPTTHNVIDHSYFRQYLNHFYLSSRS